MDSQTRNTETARLLEQAEDAYEHEQMERAIQLYNSLAEQDVPEACAMLGLIYKTGDGVEKDLKISSTWYSKYILLLNHAAHNGDASAAYQLGKLYQYGDGVTVNDKKAVQFITAAAQSGLIEAQFHLACLYRYGWAGCTVDQSLSHGLLRQAANAGHPEALYILGLDYIENKQIDQGKSLIQQAADLDFWVAKEWLTSHPAPQ